MTAATHRIALAVLMLVALAMAMRPAGADSLADFYKGKTLTILVGYGAGGGYDIYARVIAQFLGKHIPGEPSVIVQNMPGAGGLKAARYMLDVAPKDGTVLSIPSQTISFDTVTGYSAGVGNTRSRYRQITLESAMEKSSCCSTGIFPSGLTARNCGLESPGNTTTFSCSTPLISSVSSTLRTKGERG